MKEYFTNENTQGFTEQDLNVLNLTAHLRVTDSMNQDQIDEELELIFNEFCHDHINETGWNVYSLDVFMGYSQEVIKSQAILEVMLLNNPDASIENITMFTAEPATEKQALGHMMAEQEGAE